MKNAMAWTLAMCAAALAGCHGGSSGSAGALPGSATLTFTGSVYGNVSYNLGQTILSSSTPGSNPFESGVVNVASTNSTQIEYEADIFTPATQAYSHLTLVLEGTFSIPPASLNDGLVTGTTGTATSVFETVNGELVFFISGVIIDAASLTNAEASGNLQAFWKLVAGGATDVYGAASVQTVTLYCGYGNTGASIDLTITPQPINQFLMSCP